MEDSWRFRPIQGNNICPICSISHFPFCYQPLPFNRFANDSAFNRPVLDPFSGNRGMPRPSPQFDNRGGSMRPFSGNSNHSSNRNQNFERDLFWQRSQTSHWPDSALVNGVHRDGLQPIPGFVHGGNGFMRGEFVESDRIRKRMRVGEMGSDSFVHMPPKVGGYSANPARMALEDERRLSLIRDHGAPPSVAQLHGKHLSVNESSRSDWQPRFPSNTKMNSFMDPRFGSADRMGPMLNNEPSFNPQYHGQSSLYDEKMETQRGGHDLGFAQHQVSRNMRSDMDSAVFGDSEESIKDSLFASQKEQSQQSDNGDINLKHPSLESHGHSNRDCEPAFVTTGAANYVSHAQHIQDSSVVRGKDEHQHWGDHPFLASQIDDLDQHVNTGHQKFLPNDFNQGKEVQHPRVSNLTVSSGSSIPVGEKHNLHFHDLQNDIRQSLEVKHQSTGNIKTSLAPHNLPVAEQFGVPTINKPGAYLPISNSNSRVLARQIQVLSSKTLGFPHPLPPLPPHPLPLDPSRGAPLHLQARCSPQKISSMYPVPTASSVIVPLNSSALEGQPFPLKHPSPDKPKVIDATHLFLPPHRATRPDHIVIILRGLPGSGKSYLAKMLRDLEVENGGSAPRIHSMDDYFMTEVEKVEEVDSSKSSSMIKGKKRTTKKVMEYCYEPEMEEAYRSSMLKAFKKTLEECNFTIVIVDDRNLRVADFAQFWASAKRSGYEVYLLQAMYKDPVGCAARNVHGFASDDICKMAELWEDASSLYLQLDVQSLFHGDNLKESEIQEVDMDMEDVTYGEDSSELSNNSLTVKELPVEDYAPGGSFKDERWDSEGDDPTRVKELGRSKWSRDEDEEEYEKPKGARGNTNALSGLIQAYSRGEKSVHWGDQVGKTGFSIGAAKKANSLSLVIGPGAGYNLESNPLPEEENMVEAEHGWESKKRSVFEEQLRAERESFRAVFDRRRHRIGGLEMEEE